MCSVISCNSYLVLIYAHHIDYDPTELEGGEIPFEILIAIASFIGIVVVIGIATTLIIKKRSKIE